MFIYIFTLTITIISLIALPNYNFLCIIPLLCLFIFIIIKRPYELNIENSRSIFNVFVLCYAVFIKACVELSTQQLRKSFIFTILIVVNLLLLLILILFSISLMIYQFYYEKYIEPITIKVI